MKRCRSAIFCLISFVLMMGMLSGSVGASTLIDEAESALMKGVQYFRQTVSTNGGYLWTYSEDLSERAGEGKATRTQIWVQPPGTPSVVGSGQWAVDSG